MTKKKGEKDDDVQDPSPTTSDKDHEQPAEAVRPEDIRPTTLKDGTEVLSGPLPPGGAAGAVAVQPGALEISGVPGGPFNIRGARFDQVGHVTFGGQQVTVTRWEHNVIKGVLPTGVTSGEVVVVDGTGKEQKGTFYLPGESPEDQRRAEELKKADEAKK